jgi:hypothetical protein
MIQPSGRRVDRPQWANGAEQLADVHPSAVGVAGPSTVDESRSKAPRTAGTRWDGSAVANRQEKPPRYVLPGSGYMATDSQLTDRNDDKIGVEPGRSQRHTGRLERSAPETSGNLRVGRSTQARKKQVVELLR